MHQCEQTHFRIITTGQGQCPWRRHADFAAVFAVCLKEYQTRFNTEPVGRNHAKISIVDHRSEIGNSAFAIGYDHGGGR